jgi:hypothetical protein
MQAVVDQVAVLMRVMVQVLDLDMVMLVELFHLQGPEFLDKEIQEDLGMTVPMLAVKQQAAAAVLVAQVSALKHCI